MKLKNRGKIIDLFAGAGGFSLGFEMADFNLLCAVEKDDWAVDTLKTNHKDSEIIHCDITKFKQIEKYSNLDVDVIIGGPPCQGFSNQSTTKDPNDPRNSLFKNFAEWVEIVSPKVFVMENVKGILTKTNSKGDKIIDIIVATFKKLEYSVEIWVLNAAEYGVPQLRERVFIVGNKQNKIINEPPKTHYIPSTQLKESSLKNAITINEAIGDLPVIEARQGEEKQPYSIEPFCEYQIYMRKNSKEVFNHVAMNHTKRLVERFKLIQGGLTIDDLPEGFKVRQRSGNGGLSNSKFNSNYRHLKPNNISNTIPASFYSSFIHPTIPRNITAREAARIQSFPDSYQFKGQRTLISKSLLEKLGKSHFERLSQYNQIGNAVPPLLSKAIANHIANFLDSTSNNPLKKNNIKQKFPEVI